MALKVKNTVNSFLLKALHKLWKDQDLCDFSLVSSSSERFNVHRLVLVANSEMLQSFHTHQTLGKEYVMEEVPSDMIQTLLEIIYGNWSVVNDLNVECICKLGEFLQISVVKNACDAYLENLSLVAPYKHSVDSKATAEKGTQTENFKEQLENLISITAINIPSMPCQSTGQNVLPETKIQNSVPELPTQLNTKVKTFGCILCDKSFRLDSLLKLHERLKHKLVRFCYHLRILRRIKKRKRYILCKRKDKLKSCMQCWRTFISSDNHKRHLKMYHCQIKKHNSKQKVQARQTKSAITYTIQRRSRDKNNTTSDIVKRKTNNTNLFRKQARSRKTDSAEITDQLIVMKVTKGREEGKRTKSLNVAGKRENETILTAYSRRPRGQAKKGADSEEWTKDKDLGEPKRKRGRPSIKDMEEVEAEVKPKQRRGRPQKQKVSPLNKEHQIARHFCEFCYEYFVHMPDLDIHKAEVHQVGIKFTHPMACPVKACNEYYQQPYKMVMKHHLRNRHNKSYHICMYDGCNEMVENLASYDSHLNNDHHEMLHKCLHCNYQVATSRIRTMVNHMKNQHKVFGCTVCKQDDFGSVYDSFRHYHTAHQITAECVRKCPVPSCDFIDFFGVLPIHMEKHKDDSVKKEICNICNKCFFTTR